MLRRFTAAFAAIMAAGLIAGPAFAGGSVNKTLLGTALKGYDAVAYHTVGKPVEGSRRFSYRWRDATWYFAGAKHRDLFSYRWRDATWYFAGAKHRDLFTADPERYAPAYGGYCAYGMAQGAKIDIDPNAWRIVDGTLYLNVNERVQRTWARDIPGYIARAKRHWQRLMG